LGTRHRKIDRVTLGTRQIKIDTGNMGHKTKKERPG
jgi:hypothetical protein